MNKQELKAIQNLVNQASRISTGWRHPVLGKIAEEVQITLDNEDVYQTKLEGRFDILNDKDRDKGLTQSEKVELVVIDILLENNLSREFSIGIKGKIELVFGNNKITELIDSTNALLAEINK